MYTPHDYPFACSYLGHLLKHEKITSRSVLLQRIEEIEDWVYANLKDPTTGEEEWVWSNKKERTIRLRQCRYDRRITTFSFIHPENSNDIRVSRFIFFKNREDLLAFKLRFGIHREYSSNGLNGGILL
jgi:hypothetical protein